MKVSDLAAELKVPASLILDQCQRFGIDAPWAGAELSGTDVVILRAEVAGGDQPLDLTPTDVPDGEPSEEPTTEPEAAAADAPVPVPVAPAVTEPDAAAEPELSSAPEADEARPDEAPADPVADADADATPDPEAPEVLPPTAVGSMPDMIDALEADAELEPDADPDPTLVDTGGRAPGFKMAGSTAGGVDHEVINAKRERVVRKRLDPSIRGALIALSVAVVAFAASNALDQPAVIAVLWLLCAAALIVALISSIRGRYHVQTHRDRLHGVWMATIAIVLSVAAMIGLATTVLTVVRDEPASAAPANLGDLGSVQSARWGYQRLTRIAANDWLRPARDAHTCWVDGPPEHRVKMRVEIPGNNDAVNCRQPHSIEVASAFAVNREADSPYPHAAGFKALAAKHCDAILAKAQAKSHGAVLLVPEYPTKKGWENGDHDVTCVLATPTRKGQLAP